MDIHPGEWVGEAYAKMELSAVSSPHQFGGRSSACRTCFAKESATRNVLALDPSLTLTRTQYPAKVGNLGNKKPFAYEEFARLRNVQQPPTAHS
jgi:hypothetical protein